MGKEKIVFQLLLAEIKRKRVRELRKDENLSLEPSIVEDLA